MSIRERLLKAQTRPEKCIAIQLPADDGELSSVDVLLKCPTVRQRNLMAGDISGGREKIGADRTSGFFTQAIIQCTFDPKTNAPVFQPTDADSLLDSPVNGWADHLFQEIMVLMQDSDKQAKDDFPPSAPNSP